MTADDNIKQLAFERNGLFVTEFHCIFYDLFNGKGITYKKILDALKEGARTLAEIRKSINFANSGTLGQMVDHLIVAGFVEKRTLGSFKTIEPLKQSLYFISDPYMRFYLKVIMPNLATIEAGGFHQVPFST